MSSSASDNFMCIICHNIVRDCRNADCCGALFCGECVDKNDMIDCPNCRKEDVSFSRNVPMQRLADDLDVECNGCSQTYKHCSDHLSWCPFQKIKCPFDFLACEWEGRRKLLESHIKEKHIPRCPKGSQMKKCIVDDDGWYCDVCGQDTPEGLGVMLSEAENSEGLRHVECVGCFSHRPISCLGDSLGAQDRKRRKKEETMSIN